MINNWFSAYWSFGKGAFFLAVGLALWPSVKEGWNYDIPLIIAYIMFVAVACEPIVKSAIFAVKNLIEVFREDVSEEAV